MRPAILFAALLLASGSSAAPVFQEGFEKGEAGQPAGWQFLRQRGEWRWQLESGGHLGPAHSIPARLVPKKGRALTPVPEFPLYAQHSGALRHPSQDARARILDRLFYAGVRGGLSFTHYQPDYAPLDKECRDAGFFTWAWDWHGYGGPRADDQKLVSESGAVSPKLICPQVQAERGEPFWSSILTSYRRKLSTGLKTLIINYDRQEGHARRLSAPGIAQAKPLFGPTLKPTGNEAVAQLRPDGAVAFAW